ncbi:Pentatricopeptide repeat-containing protein [Apostasia shenzhenica]|uniref:Pentatricopeptide repeat-containing protein n=1 Tax=Apostasia shenzhenica TaxID=1088818 RepID=A0A2I0AZK7_9ASPA|nr:Pentatricopeptide repeat-containing protein [Apostasia shenzhenica]
MAFSLSPSSPPHPLQPSTLLPLLSVLSNPIPISHLNQIHAIAIRSATAASDDPQLASLHSHLVLSAASSSHLSYAINLLLHPSLPVSPTTFPWNALLRLLAWSSFLKPIALSLFRLMLLHSPSPPDQHSFPFVLKACAHLFALREGSQIHSYLLKLGFSSDTFVSNSLIHFYCSCGRLHVARQLFDRMPDRTKVSWNVMIDGYAMTGDYHTALSLFREMQLELFVPDVYTFQSLLCACGGLGALSLGMWVHALMLKSSEAKATSADILVNNSLVDLYSRCGSMTMARKVFDEMPARDATSWNTMILGLAMHGRIGECFAAFERMIGEDDLRPNSITLVAVLSACKHGGLVSEGFRYFHILTEEFGIEPRIEHYGCLVDMLARAGMVDDALKLVQSMPCRPDAVIWRSLLDACCRRNAGIRISESMAERAVEAEQEDDGSGAYVLLSRVYASANRWNEVGLVRKIMEEEGMRKATGCSSMEMEGVVHEFVAGDTSHPEAVEIYRKLGEVESRIAMVGYEPDPIEAPMVAGKDEVKREALRFHSERLAMAFGLLRTEPGKTMRILKNLRRLPQSSETGLSSLWGGDRFEGSVEIPSLQGWFLLLHGLLVIENFSFISI